MPEYEYGRIRVLAEKLEAAGVAPAIAEQIMAGGAAIRGNASPEKKAEWLQGAMERMDALLDVSTCRSVREACACCLGGKRLQVSKGIAKTYATFEERLAAASEAHFVFGHSVTLQDDGRILVAFEPEGKQSYRCVCLPKAKGAVSITYCYCCGGHIKHHLQKALGVELSCEVRATALSTAGKAPCSFLYSIKE